MRRLNMLKRGSNDFTKIIRVVIANLVQKRCFKILLAWRVETKMSQLATQLSDIILLLFLQCDNIALERTELSELYNIQYAEPTQISPAVMLAPKESLLTRKKKSTSHCRPTVSTRHPPVWRSGLHRGSL